MSQTAVASNKSDVLETLPPVVPSIRWRKPQKLDESEPNDQITTSQPIEPESSLTAPTGISNSDIGEKSHLTNIPPAIKIGNRTVITSKPSRQWAWKTFSSSARHDSVKFFHWVRANVEYADYPYARFDVHLDPLKYTDEEYQKYLAMPEAEDLGETFPDFLTVGGVGDRKKETSSIDVSSFQQQLLQSNKILPWTKAETDILLDLCQSYDLRWPVIIDRWHMRFNKSTVSSLRKVEDLQYRYYQIGSILAQKRVIAEATKLSALASSSVMDVPPPNDMPTETLDGASESLPASTPQLPLDPSESAALESALKLPSVAPVLSFPNTGTSNRGKLFDLVAERARRKQLEYIWNQSQEEAQQEAALRAELRAVEAQLRKLKKAGKHLVLSGATVATVPPAEKANTAPATARPTTVSSATPADPFFHTRQEVDASFNETAPVPTPGTPYLQSGRLFPPNIDGHAKLKKSTLKQIDEILTELSVPKEPIATKRSCDLFDGVRKDAMTLLILQKMLLKKEAELAEKKVKLERRTIGVTAVATEEKGDTDTPEGNNNDKSKKGSVPKDSKPGSAEIKDSSEEKASKKKRKKPTSSAPALTVVAPVVSQPAHAPVASSDDPQPADTVASSEPTAAAVSAPIAHAVTSSSVISQGKTTKAAGRKRIRKKQG